MATIRCPQCSKSIGGPSEDGGFRLRVGIVLIEPDSGLIKGPCPYCKQIILISNAATLSKGLLPAPLVPAFRIQKT